MRAHSRKSSARSVRGDGVTATRNARASNASINILTRAMEATLEQRLLEENHPLLGP